MKEKLNSLKPQILIILIGIFYCASVFLNPYKGLFYGDVGFMYLQMQDMIGSEFSDLSLQYKGQEVDPELKFFPYQKPFWAEVNNKNYFVFPPFYIFLNAFLYKSLGVNGLYILNLITFILTLYLIYRFGLYFQLESKFINLSILLYVFGMTASNYNFVFHEFTFAIFWITLSVYFSFLYLRSEENIHLSLFAFFGAVSLYFRLEFLFVLLSVGVGLILSKRKNFVQIISFSFLGFIIPFLVLVSFNYKNFHHPFGLRFLLNMEESSLFNFSYKLGVIYDLLFRKSIGLFPQSPFIIGIAFFIFLRKRIKSIEVYFSLFVVLVSLFLILISSPNSGGHISPRYLFGVYPLMSLLSVISYKSMSEFLSEKSLEKESSFLNEYGAKLFSGFFLVLVLLSFYSTYRNYQWLERGSKGVFLFNKSLEDLAEDNPIVLRDFSQSANAQMLYAKQMTFVVEKLENIELLLGKLKAVGKTKTFVSEAFVSQMNPESRVLAENVFIKAFNLSVKEGKYYFPDGEKYVIFNWLSFGKNQTLLVLNIFLGN